MTSVVIQGLEKIKEIGFEEYHSLYSPVKPLNYKFRNPYIASFKNEESFQKSFYGFEKLKLFYKLNDIQARTLQLTGLRYWLLNGRTNFHVKDIPLDVVLMVANKMTGSSIADLQIIYHAVIKNTYDKALVAKKNKAESLDEVNHGSANRFGKRR